MDESDDPVMEWSKQKKHELVSQRKSKKQRLKSSKDALALARFPKSATNPTPVDIVRAVPEKQELPFPDPFKLNDVPPLTSHKRRL
jgi:hypothetical protein